MNGAESLIIRIFMLYCKNFKVDMIFSKYHHLHFKRNDISESTKTWWNISATKWKLNIPEIFSLNYFRATQINAGIQPLLYFLRFMFHMYVLLNDIQKK